MNEIKQQLIAKIGDTTERENRVRQQVNLKKVQQPVEKKSEWAYYSTIVAFIGVLSFFIYLIPSSLPWGEEQLTGNEPPGIVTPLDEDDEEIVSTPNEEEGTLVLGKGEYYEVLKQYFPPNESEAVFSGGLENSGLTIQTVWLNDFYVKQVLNSDFGMTERIYRINDDQIELVIEEMVDETGSNQWLIEELNKLPVVQVVLKAPFKVGDQYGDWTVIDTSEQMKTTYGRFKNVIVVENTSDDIQMRKYYVQGFGEVKWESADFNEENSEYEVFINTELASFNNTEEEEKTPYQFDTKVELNYSAEAENHSGWKTSPDGRQQATIDGKLEHASEEGEALLVIENIQTKEATIYQLRDNELSQFTPKVVEWIDENRVFVIIGRSYGMVTRGGKLYELNLKDNSVTPIIEDLTAREEIMSLKVNEDGTFTYQKHVYDNDDYNYDETHIEEGTLPIPAPR